MIIALSAATVVFALLGIGLLLGAGQKKSATLLWPAGAYAVSAAAAYVLQSWWPLFLGFAVARFLSALQVGAEPAPPQRPGVTGMVINHALHAWAGVVGATTFPMSAEGVTLAAFLAVVLQGLDAAGVYRTYSRLLVNAPANVQSQLPFKFAQIFAVKVIWYGSVTLLAAYLTTHAG